MKKQPENHFKSKVWLFFQKLRPVAKFQG